jgi:hypothetical protein
MTKRKRDEKFPRKMKSAKFFSSFTLIANVFCDNEWIWHNWELITVLYLLFVQLISCYLLIYLRLIENLLQTGKINRRSICLQNQLAKRVKYKGNSRKILSTNKMDLYFQLVMVNTKSCLYITVTASSSNNQSGDLLLHLVLIDISLKLK